MVYSPPVTEAPTPPQPPEPNAVNMMAPLDRLQGVYANFASVGQSEYEFTIDFSRIDFAAQQGVLVARVSMSPLFVMQLTEALNTAWQQYADRAMPPEVHDNGGTD